MTQLHAKQKEEEGGKEVDGVKRALEEEEDIGGKRRKI